MRTFLRPLTCMLLATAVTGCGLLYHPPLQQGNLLEKKTVDQLKPGMTQRQVIALMGSPSIASPFEHNRWDYVHAFATSNGKMQVRKLSLFFNNGTLTRTEGSLFAANTKKMLEQAKMYDSAGSDRANGAKGDKQSSDDE